MTDIGYVKAQSDNLPKIDVFMMATYFASNSDFTSTEIKGVKAASSVGEGTELRRRRTRELADRVSNMKRKAREAERWHQFKRAKLDSDKKEHCEEKEES